MELTLNFVGNQLTGIHHQASKEALQAKGKLHLGLGTLEQYTRYEQLANKLTTQMNKNIDRVYCPTSLTFSSDEAYLLESLAGAYKLECAGHCHTWMQLPKTGNTAYYQEAWTKSVAEAEEMCRHIAIFLGKREAAMWDELAAIKKLLKREPIFIREDPLDVNLVKIDSYVSPFTGKSV